MLTHTLTFNQVIAEKPKVVFDTNAYRNFVRAYLSDNDKFFDIISQLKKCEEIHSIVPSSNLLTIMELYQHLHDGEDKKALEECKKAILFSFARSRVGKSFFHQPIPEIEISTRIFGKISDYDNDINAQFLEEHIKFCLDKDALKVEPNASFIKVVGNLIHGYRTRSFNSIVNNLEQVFSNIDSSRLTFSRQDLEVFKRKYGNNRLYLYANLGHSLFNAFKNRLNITDDYIGKERIITQLILDYRPALLAYIMTWEKFGNNKSTTRSAFVPNKNDLIDALILFSIVPDENIVVVTDEKMIHQIFNEIKKPNFVWKLESYLGEIGFGAAFRTIQQ